MDIWDVSRLMIRRWPVSVPLLLLTVAATVLTALNVRPDYVGATNVSLLPPIAQRSPTAGQALQVNPWDPERLSNAVVVRLNAKSLADQIEAEGFKGAWEASMDPAYQSVIRIQVTSPTQAQARFTASRLVRELDDEVSRQQARYPNLGPADKITVARLDSGDNVEVSTGKIKRAVIVVAVLGLLLTAAASLSVDAMIRRRARWRSGTAGGPHLPSAVAQQPVRQVQAGASAAMPASVDAEATQPVMRITNVPLHIPTSPAVPTKTPGPERAPSNGGSAPAPDDTTIVLPLSNAPWAERQTTVEDGRDTADKNDKTADIGS